MTVLIIEECGYTVRSGVEWADDMARYIRHGDHEVPGAHFILKLEPRDDGEVSVTDITDECSDELERASGACSPLPFVRTRSFLPERLGGAA